MKITISSLSLLLTLMTFITRAQTNDFYDDAETHDLTTSQIMIGGEIGNPGIAEFNSLPLRSVIVKETVLENGKDSFIGAYRYDGYSLYDLLDQKILKKKNELTFPPIIDLYVEVENDKGEKAILSWGEIYYPIHRHEILIATKVTRIVPSKTKELWPLPNQSRLIVSTDLLTHRNISNPVRITIRSYSGTYAIQKGMKPMYCDHFTLLGNGKKIASISALEPSSVLTTFPSVFYGRGTGIHGTTPFTGILLKTLLESYFPVSPASLQKGMFVIAGKDGYHAVYTYSELMNRNDQAEVLLVKTEADEDGGLFKTFPSADFFSDRAIKSVESIEFVLAE